jgi:hypothetical protein
MAASAAPRGIDSRLIALSQLACVVLFGALLIQPWRASSPVLGTVFIVACATFGASAISVARVTAGPLRVVFGALAVLALSVGIGELSLILDPRTTAMGGLQEASSLELAVAVAALNGLLVLYGNYALAIERRVGEALQDRVTAEQALKAKLEQRVAERTLELDDARHPRFDRRYAGLPPEQLPRTEALKNTVERMLPYWHSTIAPVVASGQRVLVAAHGNSLRALVKYLDNISDAAIPELNIPTGIPLLYELDADLRPISHRYLADEETVRKAAEAVANQGKAATT